MDKEIKHNKEGVLGKMKYSRIQIRIKDLCRIKTIKLNKIGKRTLIYQVKDKI